MNRGEPLLFKLRAPTNAIVGGGYFEHYTTWPFSLAWRAFGRKNGLGTQQGSGKTKTLLRAFVELHDHAVGEKVRIMAEHFHPNVAHRINGRAKATIVTCSRLHAIRSQLTRSAMVFACAALILRAGGDHGSSAGVIFGGCSTGLPLETPWERSAR